MGDAVNPAAFLGYGAQTAARKGLGLCRALVTGINFRLNSRLMDIADSPVPHVAPLTQEAPVRAVWQASAMALFLPGLVVAGGYGALLAALIFGGSGEGALARVCLMVLVIVVPLLLAYAGLRLATTRLTLYAGHLEAHPGFPARDPVMVSYREVSGMLIRRGLSGWITGAGTLVIAQNNGAPVIVSGLSDPDAAFADLSACRDTFLASRAIAE